MHDVTKWAGAGAGKSILRGAVLLSLPLPALLGRRIIFGRPEMGRTADKTDCAIYMLLCTVTLCYLLQRIHSLLHCENAKELRYVRAKNMLP